MQDRNKYKREFEKDRVLCTYLLNRETEGIKIGTT
jgi:hypothetical protein